MHHDSRTRLKYLNRIPAALAHQDFPYLYSNTYLKNFSLLGIWSITTFQHYILGPGTFQSTYNNRAPSSPEDSTNPPLYDVMGPIFRAPTTFLVISDTHNFQLHDTDGDSYPLRLPTPKADVLLHCGDLTQVGGIPSFKKALRMLGSIDAELKLVIAGNHDLELDSKYWEGQCADEEMAEDPDDHVAAIETMTGSLAKDAGITYLSEGTHTFTLGSGTTFTICVSPYTPAFGDWAFAYGHNEDRFSAPDQSVGDANANAFVAKNPIPDEVDIVMTHGPPKGILDRCPQGNVGCEKLLRVLHRVKPVMHCFGHIHEGNGAAVIDWKESVMSPGKEEVLHQTFEQTSIKSSYPVPLHWTREQTLTVNAAIMTGNNKPENPPWLIGLDLARG